MNLNDLLSTPRTQIQRHLQVGLITKRNHAEFPELAILNYTNKCVYENHWSDLTRMTRGLIYNEDTLDVVAKPFEKFFEYGHPLAPEIDLAEEVVATEKMDGSLGICYEQPDGEWAIATRGRFDSRQAIHATRLLDTRYSHFMPVSGLTYLFEIIYPENRVILDYGDMDDLVLLDVINHNNEKPYLDGWENVWDGPQVDILPAVTFAEALDLWMMRVGDYEGLVVDSDHGRVKLKQTSYIDLSHLVFGLSSKVVYSYLREKKMKDLRRQVMNWRELSTFVENVAWELECQFFQIRDQAYENYNEIARQLNNSFTRKEFAAVAREYAYPDLLFLILDGKSIDDAVWKKIEPEEKRFSW